MKPYQLKFSAIGALAVALVMLPNLCYLFLIPPNDLLAANEATSWLGTLLENLGRFGLMAALLLLQSRRPRVWRTGGRLLAIFSLLSYYTLWLLYFTGTSNSLALMGLAFFPAVFFLTVALQEKNYVALVFSLLFAAAHLAITANNFLL